MTSRRANTPTLTRQQIVRAAIRLVDRDGLAALSMRKLATELGVGTMSIYHHVPDKSTLYDLLLDACMAEVDLTLDSAEVPVEEQVSSVACALRRALLAHPQIAILAMSRSMRTPVQLRPVEQLLRILRKAGLSAPEAMRAVNVIGQYTIGVTSMYANHLNASDYRDAREGQYDDLTPEDFPVLLEVLQATGDQGDWDADFETGLASLLEHLVTNRMARLRQEAAE